MTQTLDRYGSDRFGPDRFGSGARQPRRHGRRVIVVVGCVLLVLATAVALAVRTSDVDSRRAYLSTDGWPERGQGAYQLGGGPPAASPDQQPVPIASLAKVMTAVVVLRHLPLDGTRDGPALVVRDEDVADTARRAGREESVVAVRAGERLTERQALMALLLPSANNVAIMLARHVSGSVDAFVDEMNATATSFGMTHTTYTDPSGFDPTTVSTAVDQLTLARHAAADRRLTAMMATASYRLPVAGTVANTDTLLGQDGFVGMKTGSHDAAGGCFMFRSFRSVGGVTVELIGVVLGQRGHNLINAALYAAQQLADRVAPAVPR
jgi:D-alanyl-D-alanine carboxypeptidase (penicillin-binding protein 5/6)